MLRDDLKSKMSGDCCVLGSVTDLLYWDCASDSFLYHESKIYLSFKTVRAAKENAGHGKSMVLSSLLNKRSD